MHRPGSGVAPDALHQLSFRRVKALFLLPFRLEVSATNAR